MVMRTNFLWLGDLVSQVIAMVAGMAAVMVLLPHFFAVNGESPTFGAFMYLFFWFITLLNVGSTIWHWQRRQRRIDAVSMQPEKWLARWHYDQWTWQTYAETERRQAYWSLAKWSIPVLLIGAFVTSMWLQIFGQPILWPLLVVIGINLTVLLLQVGVLPYYRVLHTAPEAIITKESVWIGGAVYFWQQDNTGRCAVTLVQGQPSTLEFKLQIRNGRNSSNPRVRVPVPAGYEQQAQRVIDLLTV